MNSPHLDNPLIVQGDLTVLMEVDGPHYVPARDALAPSAEVIKSPEHVHTCRITPLSIWNACAADVAGEEIVETLRRFSKYAVPSRVLSQVRDFASRYGRLQLTREESALLLTAADRPLAEEISRNRHVGPLLGERLSPTEFRVDPVVRGTLKQALVRVGFPVNDPAGIGATLSLLLRSGKIISIPESPRHSSKTPCFHDFRAQKHA